MVTYLYKVTEFPWGTCTFAEFYMSQFENKLLSQNDKKSNPIFYVRYVDNILTFLKTRGHVNYFINRLQAISVLKFTSEPMIDNRFNFLDGGIFVNGDGFIKTNYIIQERILLNLFK